MHPPSNWVTRLVTNVKYGNLWRSRPSKWVKMLFYWPSCLQQTIQSRRRWIACRACQKLHCLVAFKPSANYDRKPRKWHSVYLKTPHKATATTNGCSESHRSIHSHSVRIVYTSVDWFMRNTTGWRSRLVKASGKWVDSLPWPVWLPAHRLLLRLHLQGAPRKSLRCLGEDFLTATDVHATGVRGESSFSLYDGMVSGNKLL